MKTSLFLSGLLGLALPVCATTVLTGELRYDAYKCMVYADYALSRPSIVTFDVQTNVVVDAATNPEGKMENR